MSTNKIEKNPSKIKSGSSKTNTWLALFDVLHIDIYEGDVSNVAPLFSLFPLQSFRQQRTLTNPYVRDGDRQSLFWHVLELRALSDPQMLKRGKVLKPLVHVLKRLNLWTIFDIQILKRRGERCACFLGENWDESNYWILILRDWGPTILHWEKLQN